MKCQLLLAILSGCSGDTRVDTRALTIGDHLVGVERTERTRRGNRVEVVRTRSWGPEGRDGVTSLRVVADRDGVVAEWARSGMGADAVLHTDRPAIWLEEAPDVLLGAMAGEAVTRWVLGPAGAPVEVTVAPGGSDWVKVTGACEGCASRWRVDAAGVVVAREEPPVRVGGVPGPFVESPGDALAVSVPGVKPGGWRLRLRLRGHGLREVLALGPRARLDGDVLELDAPLAAEVPASAALDRVRAEVARVRAELRVAPVSERLDPLAIVVRGVGDCDEHVAVVVARLGAAGIAARPVVGLVAEPDRLVPHAWAEVDLPGVGWVAIDPVRGEVPADAARVPFRHDLSPSRLLVAWATLSAVLLG